MSHYITWRRMPMTLCPWIEHIVSKTVLIVRRGGRSRGKNPLSFSAIAHTLTSGNSGLQPDTKKSVYISPTPSWTCKSPTSRGNSTVLWEVERWCKISASSCSSTTLSHLESCWSSEILYDSPSFLRDHSKVAKCVGRRQQFIITLSGIIYALACWPEFTK